jgi:glycosyltransferase involved in cell wall biosynthesis
MTTKQAPAEPTSAVDGEPLPFVSVAIRSYKRLPQLFELIQRLQTQDYPRFEIVVIEQSVSEREAHREKLAELSQDSRVRILEYPALGAGWARDEAAKQSRGELVLFIDDDDLPLGTGFIRAHALNYRDPHCMAVSGRHVWSEDEDPTPHDNARNRRLCLRYSFLKMPRGRMRHTTRIQGVTQVAGTNASIRKSAIERAGGWDHEADHDEDSFNFRFGKLKKPHEYFAFDPAPVLLRRLDVGGGMERRKESVMARLRSELRFSHGVVRRYFPLRFWACYPAYPALALVRALRHVLESKKYR